MSKRMYHLFAVCCCTLVVGMAALVGTPRPTALADDNFPVYVSITGTVQSVTPTTIVLGDGTIINIPGGFTLPDGIVPGTAITVTVTVNDDGFLLVTVILGTPTPEATEETETPEATEEGTLPPTVQATMAAIVACGNDSSNPVAVRLANAFGVSVDEIASWRCEGFGFGEIARGYMLAKLTGKDPADIFALRSGGQGWGNIVKALGVNPKDLAPGQILKGNGDAPANSSKTTGQGNGKGKGHGKGH